MLDHNNKQTRNHVQTQLTMGYSQCHKVDIEGQNFDDMELSSVQWSMHIFLMIHQDLCCTDNDNDDCSRRQK